MITVTGIFDSRSGAERAVELLLSIGVNDKHLALLAPGTPDEEVEDAVARTETEEKGAGKKVGGAMGRGLGILGGIMVGGAVGSVFVPGVGAVLAAGILAAAILGTMGARLGKAAGSEIDETVVSSLRHDEIHIYEEALRQGRTILIAMVSQEEMAEATRKVLLRAGAISLDEAHESWWSGLRRAEEEEEYARRGHDFTADEPLYRRGFEAAQHPAWRGKPFAEVTGELRGRYGDDYQKEAFRRGYERGLQHYQRVIEKYQSKPNQESEQGV
ncbi:MAG TPA: hypothetical protein VGC66_19325 [Pyrinomonadaceae bacterium]|jgi:hypothetical protein